MYDYEDALREMLYQVYRNTDDFEMRISKDCYKLIREALKKQIPKKVIFQSGFKGLRCCPCCNVRFIGWGMKYCGECGRALDWSDDND